jgi:hypothetical protein
MHKLKVSPELNEAQLPAFPIRLFMLHRNLFLVFLFSIDGAVYFNRINLAGIYVFMIVNRCRKFY